MGMKQAQCAFHVLQDDDTTLLHMIYDVHNGTSNASIMFVQTETGVQEYSRGVNHIHRKLCHRLVDIFTHKSLNMLVR